MEDADLDLRNHTYARFVELGRAPRFDELAQELGRPLEDVASGMARLYDAHAVVLEADGSSIRKAKAVLGEPDAASCARRRTRVVWELRLGRVRHPGRARRRRSCHELVL